MTGLTDLIGRGTAADAATDAYVAHAETLVDAAVERLRRRFDRGGLMSGRHIRVGTRGSLLARAQASLVAQALAAVDVHAEIAVVATSGDVRPPDTAWGEGAFVDALETALRAGEIDAAVHSAKDVPTDREATDDLVVAAYVARIDARDTLVVPGWQPAGIDRRPARSRHGGHRQSSTRRLPAVESARICAFVP